jgi:hypothetical protein
MKTTSPLRETLAQAGYAIRWRNTELEFAHSLPALAAAQP